jgi:hypothetical protein
MRHVCRGLSFAALTTGEIDALLLFRLDARHGPFVCIQKFLLRFALPGKSSHRHISART